MTIAPPSIGEKFHADRQVPLRSERLGKICLLRQNVFCSVLNMSGVLFYTAIKYLLSCYATSRLSLLPASGTSSGVGDRETG